MRMETKEKFIVLRELYSRRSAPPPILGGTSPPTPLLDSRYASLGEGRKRESGDVVSSHRRFERKMHSAGAIDKSLPVTTRNDAIQIACLNRSISKINIEKLSSPNRVQRGAPGAQFAQEIEGVSTSAPNGIVLSLPSPNDAQRESRRGVGGEVSPNWAIAIFIAFLLFLPLNVFAGPKTQAGRYRIELTTQPGIVPSTGRAKLFLKVTNEVGKPVEGVTIHSLTKMPGMNMGEREETATPASGQPGVYTAHAMFAMEGGYEDTLKIEGPLGAVVAKISLATGQNTETTTTKNADGNAGGFSLANLIPWLIALCVASFIAFIIVRMRQKGQTLSLRKLANRSVIGGLILLGLILWGANYAVTHFRRAGAWTPVEIQGMEMNLPAPLGTAPVELATVESGKIESVVRYSGQAVAFSEQEVSPRVTGVISWMPFYAGDRVKRGQLLAKLDTSQSAPQTAAGKGRLAVAQAGAEVSRKDYRQSLAMADEAKAEAGMKTAAIEAARSEFQAEEQARVNAQANLEAAQSMSSDADAQLQAAKADQQYWREEIVREESLLKAGAITKEEFQREKAQAQNSEAKTQQAQARIVQVQAQIRAAESGVLKADSQIAGAKAKLKQSQSDLEAHHAHVRSVQAAASSARQKIAQAEAGVQEAKGALAGAAAMQSYSEIRAQLDGVVTQRVLSPGVLVNPGQTILKIAQISPIRLQANVAEADLQKLKVGGRVHVSAQNGKSSEARITSLQPSIDPNSRTGVAEAAISNQDSRFLPGRYAAMDFSTGSAVSALRIPARAIRYRNVPNGSAVSMESNAYVWVAEPIAGVENQFTVHETGVKIGLSDGKMTEVLAGLDARQKVVVSGQDVLKEGDTASLSEGRSSMGVMTNSTSAPGSASAVYVCPMHPEVTQDHPGTCPKCKMPLRLKQSGGDK